MTIILGRNTDTEPICCSVCGRQAGSMGYVPERSKMIAWVCDRDFCLKNARTIYNMRKDELNRYENVAVDRAKRKVLASQFEAVLNALFDIGARNLDELTPDAFTKALATAEASPDLQQTYEEFLTQYAEEIKNQVVARDPPF
jgi:hypothetical protein